MYAVCLILCALRVLMIKLKIANLPNKSEKHRPCTTPQKSGLQKGENRIFIFIKYFMVVSVTMLLKPILGTLHKYTGWDTTQVYILF